MMMYYARGSSWLRGSRGEAAPPRPLWDAGTHDNVNSNNKNDNNNNNNDNSNNNNDNSDFRLIVSGIFRLIVSGIFRLIVSGIFHQHKFTFQRYVPKDWTIPGGLSLDLSSW